MISFEPLYALMAARGKSIYHLKRDKVIGTGTLDNIRLGRSITTESVGAICEYLDCQPGDIMAYVPAKHE